MKKENKKSVSYWKNQNTRLIFALHSHGDIAQLVEHRTENPCVAGSNPAITTNPAQCGVFYFPTRIPPKPNTLLFELGRGENTLSLV